MRNFSLVNLAVSSLSFSPYFSNKWSSSIKSCLFFKHVSPVFYFNQYSTLHISRTQFKHNLGSSIKIEQSSTEEIYTEKKIEKRKAFKGKGKDLKVTSCLFYQCKSGEDGAGIYIMSDGTPKWNAKISNTGFCECESKLLGGAIYANCDTFDLTESCFDKCSAKSYSNVYAKTSGELNMKNCVVENAPNKEKLSSVSLEGPKKEHLMFNQINITENMFKADSSICSISSNCEDTRIKNVLFFECISHGSILDLSFLVSKASISSINFIRNTAAKYAIESSITKLKFEKCSFVDIKSTKLTSASSTFIECKFSKNNEEWFDEILTLNCIIKDGIKPYDIDLENPQNCWNLKSKPKASSGEWKKKIFTIMTYALVIITSICIILILYCICKVIREKSVGDTTLLLYSNV